MNKLHTLSSGKTYHDTAFNRHSDIQAYLLQFSHNKLCVMEGSYLLIVQSIDDGHSLQAHGLHWGLGGEEEPVVEVIEELQPVRGKTRLRADSEGRCFQKKSTEATLYA